MHLVTPAASLSLLLLAVVWGSAFPAIKLGLEGLSVPHLTLARHLVASACFIPFLALTRRRLLPGWRDLPAFFGLGLLGITIYHLALNYGEVRVSAGATSLIIATAPALTAVIAFFLADDRLPGLGWLGSAVSLVGVALIALGDGEGVSFDRYALLPLLSALVTALYFVLQRPLFGRYRPVEVTAFVTWAGTVPMLVFLPGFGADLADAGRNALVASLYLGLAPSAIAYTLFAFALSTAPATLVTSYLYTVPVFSLLFSWWVLGEVPSLLTLVGGAIALLGIVMVGRSRGRRRPVTPPR